MPPQTVIRTQECRKIKFPVAVRHPKALLYYRNKGDCRIEELTLNFSFYPLDVACNEELCEILMKCKMQETINSLYYDAERKFIKYV